MLVLSDSESSAMMASSEASAAPVGSQCQSPHCMTPGVCQEYASTSPCSSAQVKQRGLVSGGTRTPTSPGASHASRQWDINDSTLPMPDSPDPFDLWPSGHYRRVYRADSDDARRHVSGWAMRNTNNHNALILKKSCLGVLVCSLDCLLDSGIKVHLRPAICDKARRKQIGKPCPNVGCTGKLTLLSCRGHCGYPVTHFWRHVNNAVYFQAKGYHDHPRPEVKSLTDKGRQVFSKQMCHDRNRILSALGKRRFPLLSSEDTFEKKILISEKDEVMCSCPPFECMCSNSAPHRNFLASPAFSHMASRTPASHMSKKEHLAHLPITQINITNNCLPSSTLDASIPNIEIYQNYPSYNPGNYYHDSDVKLFKYNNDSLHYPQSHEQHFLRYPFDNLRSSHVQNLPSLVGSQTIDYPARNFDGGVGARMCSSMSVNDCRGDCSRCRINQSVLKSRGHRTSPSDESPTSAFVFKTEPVETALARVESSLSDVENPGFQPESFYGPLSSAFYADHLLSPKPAEVYSKPEHSPDPAMRDQNKPEEPTYITLTSPQVYREFHSCRLVCPNRSPASSLDASVYPAPSHEPSQIDINNASFDSSTGLIPRQENRNEDYAESSPRASPTMPHLLYHDNSTSILSSCPRNNTFHLPIGAYYEPSTAPILLANESHMVPSNSAVYGESSNTPYGFYCSDKLNTQSSQNYRNRSINITLTYN
ncbi:unnamed protein product [Candidula unifasciata]|uniref:GCM domain-containing protein n=1 Tax=Candidula unifasciata TaxID=100452 RepID=A0A8S3YQQ4_9EUPU|nr:unnamed protein product [Candidula unifasciata]